MLNSIQTLLKIFLMWKWHLKTSSTIQYKILLTLKCAWHSQWGGVICSSFRDQLIIDIRYVNKQTNNMYINKQTTVKAGFNPNSIKSFINVKTTFKNIFHNLIYINFIIFHLQMSIEIGNVSKQGKNLYKQRNNNYNWCYKFRARSTLNF